MADSLSISNKSFIPRQISAPDNSVAQKATFPEETENISINANETIKDEFATVDLTSLNLAGKYYNFAVDILKELRTDKNNSDISAQDVAEFVSENYVKKQ